MSPPRAAVVIASGPSLTPEDCEAVRQWRELDRVHREVIVTNSTYLACPWANICYAGDFDWIDLHIEDLRRRFFGAIVTSNAGAAQRWPEIVHVASVPHTRLPRTGVHICLGGSDGTSGLQAVALAAQRGHQHIALLGFDHQHTGGRLHHHDDHPAPLANAVKPERWDAPMRELAGQLDDRGVQVTNCSRATALTCFTKGGLREWLAS